VKTCAIGDLHVERAGSSGAPGSTYTTVAIVNISGTSCTLEGRPVVELFEGGSGVPLGAQIHATVLPTGTAAAFDIPPTLVRLGSGIGEAAGFLVQSSDIPVNGEQSCPQVGTIVLSLPGVSGLSAVPAGFSACGGPTISVSAIVRLSVLPATASP